MTASSVHPTPPADKKPPGLGKVVRGSALNLMGGVVSALCSFALVAVIARGTDRVSAGVLFSVTSLFLVVTSLGQLGTNVGLVYFLSRARALDSRHLIGAYLRAGLRPVLFVGVAASVLIYVFAPQLGRLTSSANAELAADFLRVLALFITPACLSTAVLAATRGLGTMRPYVLIEQAGRHLLQIALVAGALILPAATAIVWGWALPYAGAFAAAVIWLLVLRRRDAQAHGESTTGTMRQFWRFTTPRALSSVILLLIQRVDIVLVGALAGAIQAAVFTASTRFAIAGQMAPLAVGLAIQPALAAAFARSDHRGGLHVFQSATTWVMGATWPLMLTFCVNATTLLALFGSGYGAGAATLTIVAVSLMIGSACGDIDSALTMSGRSLASLGNAALALAVMVCVDFLLIPDHGSLGAAFGWAAAVVVRNLVGLAQVRVHLRLHPFSWPVATMAMLSATSFGGIELAAQALPLSGPMRLIIGVVAATATYLIGLWLLRGPLRLNELRSLRRRTPAAG